MSEKGPFGRDHSKRRKFLDDASFKKRDPALSDSEPKDKKERNPIELLKKLCEQKNFEKPQDKVVLKTKSSPHKVTVFVNGQRFSATSEESVREARRSAYWMALEHFSEESLVKGTDSAPAETDTSQESIECIQEFQPRKKDDSKVKGLMNEVFSESSVSEDVTPIKKKDIELSVSPVFTRSGSKTSRSGSESSNKSGTSSRRLEMCKKDLKSFETKVKSSDDSVDDLLDDTPHPSRGNSTKSCDDIFADTEGLVDASLTRPESCSPKKKSSSDIFEEDDELLLMYGDKSSSGSKKKNKGKMLTDSSKSKKVLSPRKKAATGRDHEDDDSPPAAHLSRGASSLRRKDKVAMPMFGTETITKIAKSNSSLKKGMFDGLHDDNSDDPERGDGKFKINFDDGKKETQFKKSSSKSSSKSSHKVKGNSSKVDNSTFLEEEDTKKGRSFKPRDDIRNQPTGSKSEGSGSSQEGATKGVKRKLRDSGEKTKVDQDQVTRRNPFKIDKVNEKLNNNNDSSEEEGKNKSKFSFDRKDKNDFKKSKESLKSKSSKKKSDEAKTIKTLHEFDMFSHAGNEAKKKTLVDTSSSATPSLSTQKSSKTLKVSNDFDNSGQDNFIKSLKKRQRDRRSSHSISKMSQLSQCLSQGSSSTESTSRTSYEYDPDFSFKKPRKKDKSNKSSQGSQPKINKFVKDKAKQKDEELALTIDELLTLPEKPEDDGKSMDELLDDLDVQIAEQKEKHRLQIEKLDEDAKIQQRRKEDREARYAANAINRNRLATELTQPVLKKMFANIRGFLEEIKAGLCKSTRHQAYHKSLKTRQALLYTMITHPFTDQQVDWAYEELADIWLRTKQEHADNNEYVWKVLMPEGFIRLYSDFFQVTMKEAEQMIKETPFDDSDDESSDSSSENDN